MPTNARQHNLTTPSALSPTAALSPSWRSPKSPLTPHRLAKLANALGVSTPIPATQAGTSYLTRSFSESASTIDRARSPTPSSTVGSSAGFSLHSPAPPTSKYLLHVVPPLHLPHDSDSDDVHGPPPPNAPGYHTQFRRGTLVPVHSTMQAQLGAIAREYALPSSTGLILYLVTSPQSPSLETSDEPGPRLSEDIWKHLWTRVVRAEQHDDGHIPSRSQTPQTAHSPLILRLAPAARSTPFLGQEQTPRPLLALAAEITPAQPASPTSSRAHTPHPPLPTPTAPSTPSSSSDQQSSHKSAPASVAPSEPGTPDTSVDDSGLRANFLDLPGLSSPSLIPILAKVEFDIDRRKAAWYEPWVRSRRVNHAKRTESRKGVRTRDAEAEVGEAAAEAVHAPIELLTGKTRTLDPFGLRDGTKDVEIEAAEEGEEERVEQDEVEQDEVGQEQEQGDDGYARLSESPDGVNSDSDSDVDDFNEEDATARVNSSLVAAPDHDPLADVFGTDEETWADIHAASANAHKYDNPDIVSLALTAAELTALPDDLEEDFDEVGSTQEEDDVLELLEKMGKPNLAISIPTSEAEPEVITKRSSSPSVNGTRKVPPPLVLKPMAQDEPPQAILTGRDTSVDTPRLAYRSEGPDHSGSERGDDGDDLDDMDELDRFAARVRNPAESDKRVGAVFDDLDLGLDPTEDFDDNDPNDRRRSQYLMSAQLDAIERTMASLSPRFMTTSLEEEQNMSFNSSSLSPSTPTNLTLSPGRNFDFLPPPSPRLPQHPDPPEDEVPLTGQSWPAVPFSAIKERDSALPSGDRANMPPSPPRLALNGISTSAPKSYMPNNVAATGLSESESRKKELEDEALYSAPSALKHKSSADLPVIPLSPDPFGRHASTPEPPTVQVSGAQWDTRTIGKGERDEDMVSMQQFAQSGPPVQGRARSNTAATNTSRFSADSLKAEPEPAPVASKTSNRATLISVKTIKKLWRKSSKAAVASPRAETPPAVPPTPTTATPSPFAGAGPTGAPQRPERPPQDQLYLPPGVGGLAPQPQEMYAGRRSLEQPNGGNMGNMGRSAIPPSPHLPSQDQLFPAGRRSLDRSQNGPPVTGAVGRLSPQPMPVGAPPPPGRPSLDQMQVQGASRLSLEQQGRRPSQEQQQYMPPPRRSLEQFAPPQQQQQQQQYLPPQQQQYAPPQQQYVPPPPPQQYAHPQQQQQQQYLPQQQLNIPVFPGRNPHPGPIITPYMQASKSASSLDRLHFDQESPYPTHRAAPSVQRSPRAPSPTSLPAIPEGEDQQPDARKSILRWKSAASTSSASSTQSQAQSERARASLDRSSTNSSGRGVGGGSGSSHNGRRPSVTNPYGSTRTSMTTPELPPSPHIPTQFFVKPGGGPGAGAGGLDHRTASQRSRLTTSSTDSKYSPPKRQISLGGRSVSPQRSMASSRDSQGSRPSFDASQFEFVSPKGGTLSYPFNTIDQQ